MTDTLLWIAFGIIVVVLLALDLGVFHRHAHVVRPKEALLTSLFWIAVSLAFNGAIFYLQGSQKGLEFLTGYLIEKSLSVDNIFVFVMIFAYFHVAAELQHRVLFWGIFGAVVMRGLLIAVGVTLISQFEWIIYIFGAFLLYTAFKLGTQKETGVHPERNPVVQLFRRFIRVSNDYEGGKFVIRSAGQVMATPLLVVLVVVETTDLIFALDSIPAIFAVTTDPFIVFTSNVFAILGLRALYFLLAGAVSMFRYLRLGLAFVLGFVGLKMLVTAIHIEIPIGISLAAIAMMLAVSIGASIWAARREGKLELDATGDESSVE